MAHYAELNENNEVIYIAYMDNEIITNENGDEIEELGIQHLHMHHGTHKKWVRTSYGGNFRGKYASIGGFYREDVDKFIPPKPFPSWSLNETTWEWDPPIPCPEQSCANRYYWDEQSQEWKKYI